LAEKQSLKFSIKVVNKTAAISAFCFMLIQIQLQLSAAQTQKTSYSIFGYKLRTIEAQNP